MAEDRQTYEIDEAQESQYARAPLIDQEFLNDIMELVDTESQHALVNIFTDLHPADIAQVINNLPHRGGKYLFELLPIEVASETILELSEGVRENLVDELSSQRISDIVDELESDDAVDIVSELDDDVAQQVLRQLSPEDSAELIELMSYDEESAGGLMGTEFPIVSIDKTVEDAIRSVRDTAEDTEDIYEVLVVDENGALSGIVDLKSLLLHRPDVPIKDILEDDAVSVDVYLDQEEVAHLMRKYDMLTVPVVDGLNRPVGIITFDDIADVLHDEAIEDMERMSGLSDHEEVQSTVFGIAKSRFPWLLVGFAGEILAAIVLWSFSASIERVIISTFFIPIIMAMGGNCGIQSSSIVVRGLATGEIAFTKTFVRLSKEFLSALISGTALALLLFGISAFWFQDYQFGLVVSLALLVVMTNATLVGSTVPLILNKFGVDPAIATGPFITTTNDALGLFIYLAFLTLIYL
ncbi:MAG: magnesium transporter [Ectothiorhodospiraceae bacterium]|nr:magnesium transporter [Ectothiorhodospiraceae bacterium]